MPIDITCNRCGSIFSVPPSRADKAKYCGQDCYHASKVKKQIGRICKFCWSTRKPDGSLLTVTENDFHLGKAQFCSRQCRSDYRKAMGFHRNKMRCDVCDEWFHCKPSYREHGVKRCSVDCKAKAYLGEGHPLWNTEGRRVETSGYVSVRLESGEWVQEHRYIVESILGRTLDSREEIHHIDHNRSNNKISNLSILKKREHQFLHRLEIVQQKYDTDHALQKNLQMKIDVIAAYGQKKIYDAIGF